MFAEANQHCDDLKAGHPLTVGLDVHGEAQAVLVDIGSGIGGDRGLTNELFTTISEHQAIALDPLVAFPLLLERILEVNRLVFVIEDSHILVEAVSDSSF